MDAEDERDGGFFREEQSMEERSGHQVPDCINNAVTDGCILAAETENAIHYNKRHGLNLLLAYCRLIEFLQRFVPTLKLWFEELKRRKMVSRAVGWKLFLPEFLYRNEILSVYITGNKQISYKQINRYIAVDTERLQELWLLDTKRILSCDQMTGPFISNLSQMYSANELIKVLHRNRRFDDEKTVSENFSANPSFYYFYRDDLTFFSIAWNAYDRRCHFANAPGDGHGIQLHSRRQMNKHLHSGLKTRKEVMMYSRIDAAELEVARLKKILNDNNISY